MITTMIIITILMLAWCAYHLIRDISAFFREPY